MPFITESRKPKVVVIVGPTASGKSDLAVRLAKKYNGEIISADSRQIYRGLDIGTGKITRKEMGGIPHYCLDLTSPKKQFSVAEYKKCAERAIKDIANRDKIPILVGGTAFWIDAVVYDMDLPKVPPNSKFRKNLERKNAKELLNILQKLDPARAKTVEQKNPRRLIRAIEIAETIGKTPKLKKRSPYDTLWIGIKPTREKIRQRIHARLLKRLPGMVREAKKLRQNGLPWKRFHELGLEYRFLAEHLRRKLTRKEMFFQLERAIRAYARRQLVWWKRNFKIHWITSPSQVYGTKMRRTLTSFLARDNHVSKSKPLS